MRGRRPYPKEVLVEALLTFHSAHSRVPTSAEFRSGLLPSADSYRRHFGSVEGAYRTIGLQKERLCHRCNTRSRVAEWPKNPCGTTKDYCARCEAARDQVAMLSKNGLKLCYICKSWKPLDEYYKNIASKSGVQGACRECHKTVLSPAKTQKEREKRASLPSYLEKLGNRSCPRCGGLSPYATWPRYQSNGKLTVYCATCNIQIADHEREIEDAHARGYVGPSNTPEYKRRQYEATAEAQGHTLTEYVPQAEREAVAGILRLQEQEEHTALKVRTQWAREWLKVVRKESDAAHYRTKSKEIYNADPEKQRQRSTVYRHANPERVAKWGDKRKRLAAQQSDGSMTHDEVGRLFGEAEVCPYCERKLNGKNKSLDHMIALSLGGSHSLQNTLICCRECNLRKSAAPFAEWIRTLSVSCGRRATRIYRQRYGARPEQASLTLIWSQTG